MLFVGRLYKRGENKHKRIRKMPKNEKKTRHRSGKYKDQHGRKKKKNTEKETLEEGNGLTVEESLRVLEREEALKKTLTTVIR